MVWSRCIQPCIDGIVALTIVNAHAAMRLLGDCTNKALDYYYLRITPPTLSVPVVEAFWVAIKTVCTSILALMIHDDPGSPPRLSADCVTDLPKRSGDFGHTLPVDLVPYTHLASVRTTQYDLLFTERPNQLTLHSCL